MPKQKPVKTYFHGSKDRKVECAIWENESRGGDTFHSVTFKLQYKEDGDYKDTTSFGAGDLYNLIRCATDAVAFLFFENVRELKKAA